MDLVTELYEVKRKSFTVNNDNYDSLEEALLIKYQGEYYTGFVNTKVAV